MKAMIFGGVNGIGKAIDNLLISKSETDEIMPTVIDKYGTDSGRFLQAQFPLNRNKEMRLHEGLAASTAMDMGASFTHVFITLGVPSHRKFDDTSDGKEIEILQRNFRAVSSALRFAKPWMALNGSYVVISSVSAIQADPGGAVYAAAKAGIEGLVRGLAREWAPARVNAIAPGPTATEQFLRNVPMANRGLEAERSPHHTLIAPSEVAEAAVGLSQMTGVSGVSLPVDLAGLSSSRRADG